MIVIRLKYVVYVRKENSKKMINLIFSYNSDFKSSISVKSYKF